MLKSYTQADYSQESWKLLLDIKAAADAQIDSAASVEDVTAALNSAEAAMSAVPTLLDDAKAAAHASLNAALAGYAEADYSPENWAVLLNAMAMADPAQAASVDDVAAALSNAQAAMAAVHTLLTDGKLAAHAGLEAALAQYSQDDYSPEEWTALTGFKTDGDAAIDEAADLAGVEAALSVATAGIAGVQTIAQALAAAKSAAHDALSAALGICPDNSAADEEAAVLAEPEAIDGGAVEAAACTAEEQAADSPDVAPCEEAADACTAGDAAEALPEEPAASSGTPDEVEKKTADQEPAPESTPSGAE